MKLSFSAEDEQFRVEIASWLKDNLVGEFEKLKFRITQNKPLFQIILKLSLTLRSAFWNSLLTAGILFHPSSSSTVLKTNLWTTVFVRASCSDFSRVNLIFGSRRISGALESVQSSRLFTGRSKFNFEPLYVAA